MSRKDFFSQQKRNLSLTWIYLFSFFLMFCGFGYAVDLWILRTSSAIPWATLSAGFFSIVTSYISYCHGDAWILKAVHAHPIAYRDKDYFLLSNLIQEMSLASGIPRPKIYIIEDEAANAFATGHTPSDAKIALTRGLIERLNRQELQAVLAHEMAHIKNYDILLKMVVTVFVGAGVFLADWAKHTIHMGKYGKRFFTSHDDSLVGILLTIMYVLLVGVYAIGIALFAWLMPILLRFMNRLLSHKREYLADATAAQMTRNPLALAEALIKISDAPHLTTPIPRNVAHLFIYEAMREETSNTHPPLHQRILRLNEMGYASEPVPFQKPNFLKKPHEK
jgi:heat shock protein HtpX